MCGNEEFQNGQTLAEVRLNRQVNNTAGRVSHQTAQTSQLTNLLHITARTRVRHHENRVKRVQTVHQMTGYIIRCFFPNLNNAAITLLAGYQTHFILFLNIQNFMLGRSHNLGLFRWN